MSLYSILRNHTVISTRLLFRDNNTQEEQEQPLGTEMSIRATRDAVLKFEIILSLLVELHLLPLQGSSTNTRSSAIKGKQIPSLLNSVKIICDDIIKLTKAFPKSSSNETKAYHLESSEIIIPLLLRCVSHAMATLHHTASSPSPELQEAITIATLTAMAFLPVIDNINTMPDLSTSTPSTIDPLNIFPTLLPDILSTATLLKNCVIIPPSMDCTLTLGNNSVIEKI